MRWLNKFRTLFGKSRFEQEMDDELRFHLEKQTEQNAAGGMSEEEARYAALRKFGNVGAVKEECRESWGVRLASEFVQDVRYGLRQLRRNPGFTAVAVLTLALGIGANAAIFSVVDAVILRPLPYPHSGRLVWISEFTPVFKAYLTGGADYVDWKNQNKTLEQIAAYDESAEFNMTGRGMPVRVHGAQVTANFFTALGVEPQSGRAFTSEEDQPNGPHVAILMHAFWQQYFGSDANILGQVITLDSAPYTIVGVMPAGFRFPGSPNAQLLLPLQLNEAHELLRVQQRLVHVVGYLKPGVTLARVRNDLEVIHKRAEAAAMAQAPSSQGPAAGPMASPPPGPGEHIMMRYQAPSAPSASAPGGASPTSPRLESAPNEHPTPGGGPASTPSHAGGTTRPREFNPSVPRPGAEIPVPSPKTQTRRLSTGGSPMGQRSKGPPPTELIVQYLGEHLAGNLRPAMLIMLGVVGLVLLIACANLANLTLARASARAREVAVRAAFGAGRGRLIRQLLTENVLLALGGGAAGLAVAAWSVDVMTRLIPPSVGGPILNLENPHVDAPVLLFTLLVSVLTGILFGLAPALASTRADVNQQLKEGSMTTTGGAGRGWLRATLAVAEVSLALMVLAGAGLLVKSFYRVLSVNLGFAPEHVLTLNLNLTSSRYPKPEEKLRFFSDVLRRAETLPGVRSAALADSLPLSHYQARMIISPPWLAGKAESSPFSNIVQMSRVAVSPAYFYTLGIPLLKGRTFTDADNERAPKVAVINEALAQHLWPNEDPVGRDLPLPGPEGSAGIRILGVVGNTHHEGPGQDVESEIYVPYLQEPGNMMQLAIRTAADPASLASAVRREVAAVDPEQPIARMSTLEQTLSESVAPRRFNMLLIGIFAAIALTLSTVGVYGVVAYSVSQRTHEVGIRMALGAQRADVLRMVVGQGLQMTLIGVGIGIVGALVLTRFLSSLLYGVKPTDPLTFVAVSLILIAVALVACYIPARRAAKVDPMVALRYE
jgi:predicted permease